MPAEGRSERFFEGFAWPDLPEFLRSPADFPADLREPEDLPNPPPRRPEPALRERGANPSPSSDF